MTIRRAREYKTSKIFWVRTFSLAKRNTIESTNFLSNKQSNAKVTVNPKHSHDYQLTCHILIKFTCLMMMMNCFCGMVDRRKAFSLISSRDHCQRSSPSRISDTPWPGFEPAQSLSSGLVEWSCVVVITTTPRRHYGVKTALSTY